MRWVLVGLLAGAVMIAIGTTLARGGDPASAYHGAGVLKLAHAVGLHGIAVLPGLAWLSELMDQAEAGRRDLVSSGSSGRLLVASSGEQAPAPSGRRVPVGRSGRARPLVVGGVGYLVVLASALLVGAQGRLDVVSVVGLVLGGCVLLTAVARTVASVRAASARVARAGSPSAERITVE